MLDRFINQVSPRQDHEKTGSVRHRMVAMLGAAAMSLLIVLTLPGCSPYPVYTHGSTGTTEAEGAPADKSGGTADAQGRGSSRPSEDRDSRDRPGVDPAIFTRVVNQFMGIPYKLGGDDEKGLDCSHFVRDVYIDYSGTRVPASTRALYELPEEVSREELVVGDLVFFSFDGVNVSHVGIYMGGGRFAHASESHGVIMSSLSDPDFRSAYKGARRVL
jgi:cell wall-associated NlpC family hydrolase